MPQLLPLPLGVWQTTHPLGNRKNDPGDDSEGYPAMGV